MKTKQIGLLLAIVSVMFLSGTTSAQQFKSPVRTLFEKYENSPGMNMMYLSKKMFELRFREKIQNNPNFPDEIIDNFNEMILVGAENGRIIPPDDMKNLKDEIKDKGYEQIVKMVEDGQSLSIYILEDKKTGKIKDFIGIVMEDDQLIMSISGNMTLEEIVTVSRVLNLNITNALRM